MSSEEWWTAVVGEAQEVLTVEQKLTPTNSGAKEEINAKMQEHEHEYEYERDLRQV